MYLFGSTVLANETSQNSVKYDPYPKKHTV